jgi:hypothetical protein
MLEIIKSESRTTGFNRVSQPACEVSQFMKNFFEALSEGNVDEVNTYFSDEMEPINIPLTADFVDQTLVVDDHIAAFSCCLLNGANSSEKLTCVLDKSEGYWQIIHAAIVNENGTH